MTRQSNLAVCILAVSVLLPLSVFARCPQGWSESPAGKCYQVSEGAQSFTVCQEETCGPQGGTLACISSEEENKFMADILRKANNRNGQIWGGWIGYHEGRGEGDWSWTSTCKSEYENWNPGDPNNYCQDEDCALMAPGLWGEHWVDAACELQAWCVCELGTELSEEYNEEMVEELKKNEENYDDCEEKDAEHWKHGMIIAMLFFVLAVFGMNVALLVMVVIIFKRLGAMQRMIGVYGIGEVGAGGYMPMADPVA